MISLDENNKKLESLKDRLIDVGDSLWHSWLGKRIKKTRK